jgi:hypothetical protein
VSETDEVHEGQHWAQEGTMTDALAPMRYGPQQRKHGSASAVGRAGGGHIGRTALSARLATAHGGSRSLAGSAVPELAVPVKAA